MKIQIKKAATNETIDIFIGDSSSTTGAGLTGLVFNSAGLTCYYRRGATGTATALTLATQTVGGAHSDGGFVEIDSTNMPGMYRLDLSDAIVATGERKVTMYLHGATNMAPITIEIELVDEVQGTWNSAWDAEVESEVNDALVALNLDHLMAVAVTGADVVDNSALAYIAASGATADWDTFVNTSDSLQALRDHIGDGTNLTEAA